MIPRLYYYLQHSDIVILQVHVVLVLIIRPYYKYVLTLINAVKFRCMYARARVCVGVSVCIYVYECVYVCVVEYVSVCVYVIVSVWMWVCLRMHVHMGILVCSFDSW